MRLKNFQDLIEECLTKEEIAEIEQQAKQEIEYLQALQKSLKKVIDDYMEQNNVGFNGLFFNSRIIDCK